LRKELKRISRELNLSIFHITHEPEEALALGDKVCVMLDGRIRQVAEATELFRAPSDPDVAKFLGMKNILAVSDVRGGVCTVYDRQVHANAADKTTAYIWIMPEEILVSNEAFGSSARNQFKCRVAELHHYNSLLAVQVDCGGMKLTALITYRSCEELKIKVGSEVYVTFKSSAVHCF
jgi:molybdate/tungstate transport system ATP-binding protein